MAAAGAAVEPSQHIVEHIGEAARRGHRSPGVADCSRVVHLRVWHRTRYFGMRVSRAHCLDNTSARTMRMTTKNDIGMEAIRAPKLTVRPPVHSTPRDAIRVLISLCMNMMKMNSDGKVIDISLSRARILVVP